MKKLNHISWTFALSLWIFSCVFKESLPFVIIFSLITASIAWLPDMDIKIIKKLETINKETFYIFSPITYIFKLIFKHRTITHAIWIPLALFFLSEFYFSHRIILVMLRVLYIAIILHIFEDAFTVRGVKIFYPIPLKLKLFNFSTQSKLHFYILEFFAYAIICLFILYGR